MSWSSTRPTIRWPTFSCASCAACSRSHRRATGRCRSSPPTRSAVPGVEALEAALDAHREQAESGGERALRRRRNLRNEVLELAVARLRRDLEQRLAGDREFERLLDEVAARRLDPASAARALSERSGA